MAETQGGEGQSATNGAAAGSPSPWAGLSEDIRGFVEMKGWKDPGAAIESYRNLEKLRGVPAERLLTLPAKEDDAEAWNSIYGRLGRPSKPEEYGIEGVAPELIAEVHKAGLTKRQASALAGFITERAGKSKAEADAKWEAESAAADEALKREWGGEFETNLKAATQLANRVRTGLNMDQAQWDAFADKMQRAVGVETAVKMFALLGRGLGEHKFVEGEGKGEGFGMTPARAKAELGQLRLDPEHQKRKMSENKAVRMAAVEREMALDKIAFPESA